MCLSKTEAEADNVIALKQTAALFFARSNTLLESLDDQQDDLANRRRTACVSLAVLHSLKKLLNELGQSADANDLVETRFCSCRSTIQLIDEVEVMDLQIAAAAA